MTTPFLQKQLEEQKKQSARKRFPKVLALMQQETKKLIDSKIAEQSLKEEEKIIDFSLPNTHGEQITLSDILKTNPVVLVFYRGAWCPYCNLTLRAYEKTLPEIEKLGAKLVAVSPQVPDKSILTTEKDELSFEVLSDVGNKVTRQYKLVFSLPQSLIDLYKGWGNDLVEYNGDHKYELPMPATFVIDKNGIIRKAFVSADYTKRLEPEEIIKTLQKLK